MSNNRNGSINTVDATDQMEGEAETTEVENIQEPGWRNAFHIALEYARRQQKPAAGRRELGRDKSKSLLLLLVGSVMLLLLFFVLFSTSKQAAAPPQQKHRGQPSLGRKITPGQENQEIGKTIVPMLAADIRPSDSPEAGQITAEDVGRTAASGIAVPAPSPKSAALQQYAIGRVDFSDPLVGRSATSPPARPLPNPEHVSLVNEELKKPSLVFVRSTQAAPTAQLQPWEEEDKRLALPAGTRLLARLEAPLSSATAIPAVAVVEYNYERNGQILVPAGAKLFGRLAQVNSSGYVDVQFSRVELPNGTAQKIDASAMSLDLGPLKGYVSGKKKGTKFLVRSLTGIGTMASYLVGPQGAAGEGVLSSNTLMRERMADNIGTAGQEELNSLALNENPVVTVPANTRFYIVLQKPTADSERTASRTRNSAVTSAPDLGGSLPTLEELRQLLDLRREINELYTQSSSPPPSQIQPPE